MNKIEKMMQKDFWDADIPDHPAQAWEQGYKAGANAVLNEINIFLDNYHLGDSGEEKFYKLDLMADIAEFITSLKGGDK